MRGDFNGSEGEFEDQFKLKIATDKTLGGITASEKTDNETEEVKIDPKTGKLYAPTGKANVEIATSEKIGGIKAEQKTPDYEEEAKIDPSTGKIYIKIPVASSTKAGGILAEQKTSKETVEVKIDPKTGKLYVEPIGEGSVTYNYTNYPDDEDLTEESISDEKVIKFANKDHNSGNFSGLGRVYLRRNMSSGKNVLTQSMVNKSNTRYIVQYDYDLNGAEINMPDNCVFDFQGGSFKNGTINGNKTSIAGVDTYNILNDTIIKDFSIEYIDVRWVGAISSVGSADMLESDDSSQYFQRAIDLSKYNRGCSIRIIGRYRIASTVETERDLKLFGVYKNSRVFDTSFQDLDSNCVSEIFVDNCTAFKMIGRGDYSRWRSANLYINNLFVRGASSTIDNSIFIEYTATGAPTRVGHISDLEITRIGKVFYFHDDENYTGYAGTNYANLVIERVVEDYCNQFLVSKTENLQRSSLLNLIIRDSNIEGNYDTSIDIDKCNGPVIIENCIFENEPIPLKIGSNSGSVDIRNNYFEAISGDYFLMIYGNTVYNNNVTVNYYGNTVGSSAIGLKFTKVTINKFEKFVINEWNYPCEFSNCLIKDINDITTGNIIDESKIYDVTFIDDVEEEEGKYIGVLGYTDIGNGVLGKKITTSSLSMCEIKASLNEGDTVTVISFSTKSSGGYYITLIDNNGYGVISSGGNKNLWTSGHIQISTFKISKDNPDKFFVGAAAIANDDLTLSNIIVYVNKSVKLNQIGIPTYKCLPNKLNPETSGIGEAKDKFLFSNGYFHDPYYIDGKNVRNIETSMYSNVRVISKWNENMMHAENVIYKIVGNIDLNGETKTTPANCILDFTSGGTINNGTINLSKSLLYPQGLNIKRYFKNVTVTGIYAEGQLIYDPDSKRMKYYNGTSWKFLTDSDS